MSAAPWLLVGAALATLAFSKSEKAEPKTTQPIEKCLASLPLLDRPLGFWLLTAPLGAPLPADPGWSIERTELTFGQPLSIPMLSAAAVEAKSRYPEFAACLRARAETFKSEGY